MDKLLEKIIQEVSEYTGKINKGYKDGDWNHRLNFQYMGTYWYKIGRLRFETCNFRQIEVFINEELLVTVDDNTGILYKTIQNAKDRVSKNIVDNFLNEVSNETV